MKLGWIAVGLVGVMTAGAQEVAMHRLHATTEAETQKLFKHYTRGSSARIISGHRGGDVAGYPENSLAAFENGLRHAPMMFETDPHLTKDGQIVIMHDATLDRTTLGHGKVKDYTLAEVQAMGMKDFEGNPVPTVHPPSLKEAILWAKGKTILNLDIKDVPQLQKAQVVKDLDAFAWSLFTVHKADEAKVLYDFDKRCLFAAVIFTAADLKSYDDAGIPADHIAIAYVGPKWKPEEQALYDELHKRGMMIMVAVAPSDDKLATKEERAAAYRKLFEAGADVIESDRPIEVWDATKNLPRGR